MLTYVVFPGVSHILCLFTLHLCLCICSSLFFVIALLPESVHLLCVCLLMSFLPPASYLFRVSMDLIYPSSSHDVCKCLRTPNKTKGFTKVSERLIKKNNTNVFVVHLKRSDSLGDSWTEIPHGLLHVVLDKKKNECRREAAR